MHWRTAAIAMTVVVLGLSSAGAGQDGASGVRLLRTSAGVRRDQPASITYVVDRQVHAVTIEIVDEHGRVARRFSSLPEEAAILGGQPLPTSAGGHVVTWDLRHACGTAFAGIESRADIEEREPWAVPGTFNVRLTAGQVVVTQPLVVTLASPLAATRADLEAQLELSLAMCDRRRTALSAIQRLRSHAEMVKGRVATEEDGARKAAHEELLRRMSDADALILGESSGPEGATPGEFLPWCARQAALQREVTAGDRRPLESEYATFRSLGAELDALLRQLPSLETHAAGQPGASIQFDSQGVDFRSWLQKLIARLKKGWFIPFEVSQWRGKVAATFYVHRSGEIDEVTITESSPFDSLNTSSRNAILNANPVEPLPKEYRGDRCFFTVRFFYNETPSK